MHPPKNQKLKPIPQYFRMWLYLKTGSLKKWWKWDGDCSLKSSLTAVLVRGEYLGTQQRTRGMQAQRDSCVRTQQKGSLLPARKEASGENTPADTLILNFWPSDLWENLLFKQPSLWYFVMGTWASYYRCSVWITPTSSEHPIES